jgi:hypothetical protein
MGTNFNFNIENPKVLAIIENLGGWKAPIKPLQALTEEQAEEARKMKIPESVILANMRTDREHSYDDLSHIGKRSGIGGYCYSCNVWLRNPANECTQFDVCKYCGSEYNNESVDSRPTSGVHSSCGFSWANWPDAIYRIMANVPEDMPLVVDEYGRTMTANEFSEMLREDVTVHFISVGSCFT